MHKTCHFAKNLEKPACVAAFCGIAEETGQDPYRRQGLGCSAAAQAKKTCAHFVDRKGPKGDCLACLLPVSAQKSRAGPRACAWSRFTKDIRSSYSPDEALAARCLFSSTARRTLSRVKHRPLTRAIRAAAEMTA